jgi:starch-binding outer membrane protein, SusD/RagB family
MKTRIFAILGIVGAISFSSLGTSIVRLVLESLSAISHSFSPNKALVTPFRAFPVTTILLPTLPCAGIKLSITGALAIVSFIDNSSHETRKHAASRNVNIYFIFFIRFSFYSLILITSKTPSDVARNMQRSSVADVYALIEGDLETIVDQQLLPVKQPDALLGRADMNAAKALLAKVYATHYAVGDKKYQQALNLCKDVLGSETVGNPQTAADLVPYASVFDINNEMNKEIIFAVRYLSGNIGLGSPFGNLFAPINNGANVKSYRYG